MSQIPFVNLLGDELQRAAERAQPSRKSRWGRRRLGLFAVAGALLVSGSAVGAGLLAGDAEHQATASVACYDGADSSFDRSVAVVPPEAGSVDADPVELCRRELALAGQDVHPLVACGTGGGVAVIPGRGRADCARAGFGPLARRYASARRRTAKLERRILAIEASADCIAPRDLVRRVQRLLDGSGWTGWSARARSGAGAGPCGTVSSLGGDGNRYISSSLDADTREVLVSHSASRRIINLLYSAESSLLLGLFRESGARCFTYDGFVERAREVFAAHGIDVAFRRTTIPRNTGLDDEDGRWTRYRAGCAVLAAGDPGPNTHSVIIQVFQRR
jgi:hypothetical protein